MLLLVYPDRWSDPCCYSCCRVQQPIGSFFERRSIPLLVCWPEFLRHDTQRKIGSRATLRCDKRLCQGLYSPEQGRCQGDSLLWTRTNSGHSCCRVLSGAWPRRTRRSQSVLDGSQRSLRQKHGAHPLHRLPSGGTAKLQSLLPNRASRGVSAASTWPSPSMHHRLGDLRCRRPPAQCRDL